jgi:GT2 family glycosyltransferase
VLQPLVKNSGFGVGNNVGIQRALDSGAEWVLLANQDIVFQPDTVQHLTAAALRLPEYGILSALQLSYDGQGIDTTFRLHLLPTRFYDDLVIRPTSVEDVYEAPFVPAACVLIPRKALMEVGGFDPLFFLYAEDDDLCERMKKFGWKAGVVPKALVLHWHGFTNRRRTFSSMVNMEYSRSVLELKWSRHSVLATLLKLGLRRSIPRSSFLEWSAGLLGLAWCAVRVRSIVRHRRSVPFAFKEADNKT